MSSAIVAVIGTLLGTLLGALSTYLTQAASYRRESNERQRVLRRQVYVEWLRIVHQFFAAVRDASRRHRNESIEAADLVSELDRIPPEPGQVALEHLRLIANEDVAASAARLWGHMRQESVPRGQDRSGKAYRTWVDQYWRLRRAFIDAAREDLGLTPFDWTKAGVGPGSYIEDTAEYRPEQGLRG